MCTRPGEQGAMARLYARFGSRGLAGFASAAMLFGVGWLVLIETAAPTDEFLFHLLIPQPVRVGLWWGSALITVIFLCSRRWSWVAWAVLPLMPAERAASNLASAAAWLWPGGFTGSPRAVGELLMFGGAACLSLIIGFWQEDSIEKIARDRE